MIRLVLAALLLLATPALAAVKPPPPPPPLAATCATLSAVFRDAVPGRAIVVTGTCAALVQLRDRHKSPAVTIDARGAVFGAGLQIFKAGGIHVTGGRYGPIAGPATSFGFRADGADDVSLTGARVTGVDFGIQFSRSTRVAAILNRVDDIGTDGIRCFNVAGCVIDRNFVLITTPAGTTRHPDGIQLASDGGADDPTKITRDAQVTGNEVVGDGQGITAFRSGADDGGYDRLTITGNRVRVTFGNGLAIYACRACVVTGNDVGPLPASTRYIQVNATTTPGSALLFCANRTVRMTEAGTKPCPITP